MIVVECILIVDEGFWMNWESKVGFRFGLWGERWLVIEEVGFDFFFRRLSDCAITYQRINWSWRLRKEMLFCARS